QVAHGRGRGVARADDEHVLAGVGRAALAEYVLQPVGDVRLGRQFTNRRDAAVAQPAVLPVGAGAVEYHVRLLEALGLRGVAEEQPDRLPAAVWVVGALASEQAAPPDVQHLRFRANAILEVHCLRQWLKIGGDVPSAGDALRFGGKSVLAMFA